MSSRPTAVRGRRGLRLVAARQPPPPEVASVVPAQLVVVRLPRHRRRLPTRFAPLRPHPMAAPRVGHDTRRLFSCGRCRAVVLPATCRRLASPLPSLHRWPSTAVRYGRAVPSPRCGSSACLPGRGRCRVPAPSCRHRRSPSLPQPAIGGPAPPWPPSAAARSPSFTAAGRCRACPVPVPVPVAPPHRSSRRTGVPPRRYGLPAFPLVPSDGRPRPRQLSAGRRCFRRVVIRPPASPGGRRCRVTAPVCRYRRSPSLSQPATGRPHPTAASFCRRSSRPRSPPLGGAFAPQPVASWACRCRVGTAWRSFDAIPPPLASHTYPASSRCVCRSALRGPASSPAAVGGGSSWPRALWESASRELGAGGRVVFRRPPLPLPAPLPRRCRCQPSARTSPAATAGCAARPLPAAAGVG